LVQELQDQQHAVRDLNESTLAWFIRSTFKISGLELDTITEKDLEKHYQRFCDADPSLVPVPVRKSELASFGIVAQRITLAFVQCPFPLESRHPADAAADADDGNSPDRHWTCDPASCKTWGGCSKTTMSALRASSACLKDSEALAKEAQAKSKSALLECLKSMTPQFVVDGYWKADLLNVLMDILLIGVMPVLFIAACVWMQTQHSAVEVTSIDAPPLKQPLWIADVLHNPQLVLEKMLAGALDVPNAMVVGVALTVLCIGVFDWIQFQLSIQFHAKTRSEHAAYWKKRDADLAKNWTKYRRLLAKENQKKHARQDRGAFKVFVDEWWANSCLRKCCVLLRKCRGSPAVADDVLTRAPLSKKKGANSHDIRGRIVREHLNPWRWVRAVRSFVQNAFIIAQVSLCGGIVAYIFLAFIWFVLGAIINPSQHLPVAIAASTFLTVALGKIKLFLDGKDRLQKEAMLVVEKHMKKNLGDVLNKIGLEPGSMTESLVFEAIEDPEHALSKTMQQLLQRTPLGGIAAELGMDVEAVTMLANKDPACIPLIATKFDMETFIVQAMFAVVTKNVDMLLEAAESLAMLPSVGLAKKPGDSGAMMVRTLVKMFAEPELVESSTKRLFALFVQRLSEDDGVVDRLAKEATDAAKKAKIGSKEDISSEEIRSALRRIDPSVIEPVMALCRGQASAIQRLTPLLREYDLSHGTHLGTFATLTVAIADADERKLMELLCTDVAVGMLHVPAELMDGLSLLCRMSCGGAHHTSPAQQVDTVQLALREIGSALGLPTQSLVAPHGVSVAEYRALSYLLLVAMALGTKGNDSNIPRARALFFQLCDDAATSAEPTLQRLTGVSHDKLNDVADCFKALFVLARQPVVDARATAAALGIDTEVASCIAQMVDTKGSSLGSIANLTEALEHRNPLVWLARNMRLTPAVLIGLLNLTQRRVADASKGNIREVVDCFLFKISPRGAGGSGGDDAARGVTTMLINILCAKLPSAVADAAIYDWIRLGQNASRVDNLVRSGVEHPLSERALRNFARQLLWLTRLALPSSDGQALAQHKPVQLRGDDIRKVVKEMLAPPKDSKYPTDKKAINALAYALIKDFYKSLEVAEESTKITNERKLCITIKVDEDHKREKAEAVRKVTDTVVSHLLQWTYYVFFFCRHRPL
jgi:hypothetical protein